jgi:hypothetical protein
VWCVLAHLFSKKFFLWFFFCWSAALFQSVSHHLSEAKVVASQSFHFEPQYDVVPVLLHWLRVPNKEIKQQTYTQRRNSHLSFGFGFGSAFRWCRHHHTAVRRTALLELAQYRFIPAMVETAQIELVGVALLLRLRYRA